MKSTLNQLTHFLLFLTLLYLLTAHESRADSDSEQLRIAIAGPLSTADSVSMNHIANGINLYLDSVNNGGGIHGKRLVLDKYDDYYDPNKAKQVALDICNSSTLAVIGHLSNSCTEAAAEIYGREGLVAISPTATTTDLCKRNEWFFQTIFENDFQGEFLAKYMSIALTSPTVTIVYDSIKYHQRLMTAFESVETPDGPRLNRKLEINLNSPELDDIIEQVANTIVSESSNDVILLAVDPPSGSRLLRRVFELGGDNKFFLPHDYSYSDFVQDLKSNSMLSDETDRFAENLYLATPLMFDIAGRSLELFSIKYRKRYNKSPNWVSVMAYDAIKLIVEAIKNSDSISTSGSLSAIRTQIRDALSALNMGETAIEGISGPLGFDKYGNSARSIEIGIYRDNNFNSAPIQFRSMSDRDYSREAFDSDRVIEVNDYLMYETNVVYTGVRTKKIEDIDLHTMSFIAEFYLWFRFNGDIELGEIDFLNAVEPIEFGKPIDEIKTDAGTYIAYDIRGRFKLDHIPSPYSKHIVAISFMSKTHSKNDMLFAIDWSKMYEKVSGTHAERLKQVESRLLDFSSEWSINELFFYQDEFKKHTLGNPKFAQNTVDYSRFNIGLVIEKKQLSMRGLISGDMTPYYAMVSFVILLLLAYLKWKQIIATHLRLLWFFQVMFTLIFLITIEQLVGRSVFIETSAVNSQLAIRTFDILWWYLPAHLLGTAVSRFVWDPLEKKTSQKIPTLLRGIVAILFFVLSSLGIVAFVFQYKITSLLATSGVIAMIIGLAIQINIANVFSGIALNLERPFKIGDWIMVHGRTPLKEHCIIGCVVDIGWRTCRLKTTAKSLIIIPNNVISEKTVTNFMLPTETSRFELLYYIDFKFNSETVLPILHAAVDSLVARPESGILDDPKYSIRMNGATPMGVEYEVRYHIIPRVLSPARARHMINESVIEHLLKAGIRPAHPTQSILLDGLTDDGNELDNEHE